MFRLILMSMVLFSSFAFGINNVGGGEQNLEFYHCISPQFKGEGVYHLNCDSTNYISLRVECFVRNEGSDPGSTDKFVFFPLFCPADIIENDDPNKPSEHAEARIKSCNDYGNTQDKEHHEAATTCYERYKKGADGIHGAENNPVQAKWLSNQPAAGIR